MPESRPTPGVVISGAGESEYSRGTTKTTVQLAIDAGLAACADAGVEPGAVDGLVLATSRLFPEDLIVHLGIGDLAYHSYVRMGGASSVAGVALAARAVAAGIATRVLVVVASLQASGSTRLSNASGGHVSALTWPGQAIRTHLDHPHGLFVPMQWYALHAHRWYHETGADPAGMEAVALSTREHAHRNAKAYFRGRELTAEQYRESPVIVSPFHLFDICLESDGAACVLVEAAPPATSRPSVFVAGGGEGHPDSPDDLPTRPDVQGLGIAKVARRVFADLALRPDDFDFAEIYDCFTFTVLRQLEEMGFCARGESPDFVSGRRIAPGGAFPVNTHGGLLSQAHISGMNHVVEAVRQLRGEAGEAQVTDPAIGLVSGYGDFGDGSLIVLRT